MVVWPSRTLSAPSSRRVLIPRAVAARRIEAGVGVLHHQRADLVVDHQELVDAGAAAVAVRLQASQPSSLGR